jgi:protein-tyrosine-phosphatase
MTSPPGSVLFCCTHNSIRSPMAEGILKYLQGKNIFVDSVGVRAQEIDGFVIAVMDEIGIDMTKHRSKTFDDLEDSSFDLIISLSPEAQHKAMEMTRTMACDVEYWPTLDPSVIEGTREERLEAYRDVRDKLMMRIRERFPFAGAPEI